MSLSERSPSKLPVTDSCRRAAMNLLAAVVVSYSDDRHSFIIVGSRCTIQNLLMEEFCELIPFKVCFVRSRGGLPHLTYPQVLE